MIDAPLKPRLQLKGITKQYPGVLANDGVNFQVMPGEIHALLGENGAGKSTLMKILYGATQADAGEIWFNGEQVHIANPQAARALGLAMVFQHFSLFDTVSVAENVWLGLGGGLSLKEVSQRIESKAKDYGLEIDPRRPVHTLSVGEMQRVEIIRALLSEPQLLILDEPTSVLTPQAVDKLFVVLRVLAAQGCSIVYISHKLHEIRSLCSACTVLRGGKVSGVCDPRQESNGSLSRMMIGAEPPALKRDDRSAGEVRLALKNFSLPRADQFGVNLENISLTLRAGEVLGIAGVSGNGQRELLQALSGEDTRGAPGSVLLGGKDVVHMGPAARRSLGLHCVPEERLGRGAVPSMSLAQNLMLTRREALRWPSLSGGWIQIDKLNQQAQSVIARFSVKASGPDATAQSLSGGNLQKFVVGREVDAGPRVFIVSQPTWGVDVGAAARIRAEFLALRDRGCAVLVISEELEELFEVCDRLQVMARGFLSPAVAISDASVQVIGEWMSGLWDDEVQQRLRGMQAQGEAHASA